MSVRINGREVFNNTDINNPDIDGGTIDNTTIGGTTPAAGAFTTLKQTTGAGDGNIPVSDASGNLTLTASTGTGSPVRATSPTISSPTISGHATIESVTATGATGTGKLVFDTSPTFTTQITTPAIVATSNNIKIKPTTDATTAVQLANKDGNTILNVDTTNNRVGILTSSPQTQLDVNGAVSMGNQSWPTSIMSAASGRALLGGSYGTTSFVLLDNTPVAADTGTDGVAFILRTNDSGPVFARVASITALKENATQGNPSAYLVFKTSSGSSVTERMRIASDGKVGIGTSTPTSTLHNSGSLAMPITTKTADYTATSSDHTILCNKSDGNITITLPAVSGCSGRIYNIKKIDSSAYTVTIDGNSSETIDGALTQTLTTQYESITIQCDGSAWYII